MNYSWLLHNHANLRAFFCPAISKVYFMKRKPPNSQTTTFQGCEDTNLSSWSSRGLHLGGIAFDAKDLHHMKAFGQHPIIEHSCPVLCVMKQNVTSCSPFWFQLFDKVTFNGNNWLLKNAQERQAEAFDAVCVQTTSRELSMLLRT